MFENASKRAVIEGIMLLCVFTYACNAITPLPRIKARTASPYAEFYNVQTGESFSPIGANYVPLYWIGGTGNGTGGTGGTCYHSAFIPGLYDSAAAENALTIMQQSGYNLVRVFIYQGDGTLRNLGLYCIEGPSSTNVPALYQPYLDNLLDFLTRANSHGIYVQIVTDRTPTNAYYSNQVNAGYSCVTGSTNREYLVSGAVTAKKTYLGTLVQAIIDHDPNLLSTVFGYELKNELNSTTDSKPFSYTSGWYTMGNGIDYNMGDAASRQACQNDNIKNWANQSVSAIKAKDPDAMVCISVFTLYAVGKTGMTGLLPITTSDKRWPALPSLLLQTNIDYIDIHSYKPNGWNTSMASAGWPSSLDKTLKPFTCGEFGALRTSYGPVTNAASVLYSYRENILDSGFRGALLFTWDTETHTRWTAMEAGAIINERLKPEEWSNWQFAQDGFMQFWDPNHSVSGCTTSGGNLIFDINGSDSYIYSPLTRLDSDKYRYLKIKVKNQTSGTQAQVFWTTKTDATWNDTKSVTFNIVPNCNGFKTYLVDLYDSPNWSGLVNQLRFDPANNSVTSGHCEIDFVEAIKDGAIIYPDINDDNTVDFKDFSILAQSWMSQSITASWSEGDLNNDLIVNNEDIMRFASEWLKEAD
jgi:hypothetical protein